MKKRNIEEGTVLVAACKGLYLTFLEEYVVSKKENGNLIIIDDEGDPLTLQDEHLEEFLFVIKDSEEYESLLKFSSLGVGDMVVCKKSYSRAKADREYKVYKVTEKRIIIEDDMEDRRYPVELGTFHRHYDLPNMGLCRHINNSDYYHLIDIALDNRDESWFKEIANKLEGSAQ